MSGCSYLLHSCITALAYNLKSRTQLWLQVSWVQTLHLVQQMCNILSMHNDNVVFEATNERVQKWRTSRIKRIKSCKREMFTPTFSYWIRGQDTNSFNWYQKKQTLETMSTRCWIWILFLNISKRNKLQHQSLLSREASSSPDKNHANLHHSTGSLGIKGENLKYFCHSHEYFMLHVFSSYSTKLQEQNIHVHWSDDVHKTYKTLIHGCIAKCRLTCFQVPQTASLNLDQCLQVM